MTSTIPAAPKHKTNVVPIWVVRVGDDLYVRSYRGPSDSWYRRARRNGSGRLSVGGVDHAVRFIAADPTVRTQVDEAYAPSVADTAASSGR